MKFEVLKINNIVDNTKYESSTGQILLNEKVFQLKNISDYFVLKNSNEYKQFIQELTKEYIERKQFKTIFSRIFQELYDEIKDLRINVSFFWFIITDILNEIKTKTGEYYVKNENLTFEDMEQHVQFYNWLDTFFTRLEMLDLTPEQRNESLKLIEIYENHYLEKFKKDCELYKKLTKSFDK